MGIGSGLTARLGFADGATAGTCSVVVSLGETTSISSMKVAAEFSEPDLFPVALLGSVSSLEAAEATWACMADH